MKFLFKKFKQKSSETEGIEEGVSNASILNQTARNQTAGNQTAGNLQEQKLLFQAAYGGQCGVCTFAKLVTTSKDSHFIMCSHPKLPKYQGQPVLNCDFVEFRKDTTS